MATTALHLPEDATSWVRSRVEAGEAPSAEAYVADVLRRDRERAEETAHLQRLVDEGLASGISSKTVDEIFDEVEAKYFG